MSTLKTVQIVSSVADEASGPSYSVTKLHKCMMNKGMESFLFSLDWDNTGPKHANDFRFPVNRVLKKLGISKQMNLALRDLAMTNATVCMHAHGLWMMPNLYPAMTAKKYNIPFVVSPRGSLSKWSMENGSKVKKIFWPIIQRPALLSASCFHATSYQEYEDIRNLNFKQPVAIIPNGIDEYSRFSMGKKSDGTRQLLYLGRIHPKKGITRLLKAWRNIHSNYPNWTLKIVGPLDNEHAQNLISFVRNEKLPRIEFSGPLYGEDKLKCYQSADLFILPTFSENFGMVVAEALSHGLPVITTYGTPWSELSEKHCGWYIPDNNVDTLSQSLLEAMRLSPDCLEEMGLNGQKWMRSEYNWDKITDKFLQLYEWLNTKNQRPDFVKID